MKWKMMVKIVVNFLCCLLTAFTMTNRNADTRTNYILAPKITQEYLATCWGHFTFFTCETKLC